MRRAAYIYGLYSPDGELRYVGQTMLTPKRRLGQHIHDSHRKNHTCQIWIRSLSGVPQIRALEICEPSLAAERERAHVSLWRRLGARLTNMTDGGLGTPGHIESAKTRSKKSASHTGIRHTAERRKQISDALMGHGFSPETLAKMSSAAMGNKHSLGRKYRPETIDRLRAASKGNMNCLGRVLSPETKAKLSLARRRWWTEQRKKDGRL